MRVLLWGMFIALGLFTGCESDDSNQESISESLQKSVGRNSKASCVVDKGFSNEIDCYEGEIDVIKKQCDGFKKRPFQGVTITYSETSGCPTDKKYIGCCAGSDWTQCYYLSDIYNTPQKKEEQSSYLKSVCDDDGISTWEK